MHKNLDGWEMKVPGSEDPFCPAGHLNGCLSSLLIVAAGDLMDTTCPSCSIRSRGICSGIEFAPAGHVFHVNHVPFDPESFHIHTLIP